MKPLNLFLATTMFLGAIFGSSNTIHAGGDAVPEEDVISCNFTLKNIRKRYVVAVSSLGQQQFQTEVHFNTKTADKKVRLTFHEATTNKNFAKCETFKGTTTITIPYNYGQLPIIMNMWRRARTSKGNEKITMVCSVVIKEAESFRRGSCELK